MVNYSVKKITQILNYFAIQNGGEIDKLKAIKLIFLADRYHLRNYGRLISDDKYFAMEYGPVGSKTYDICEQNNFLKSCEKKYVGKYLSLSLTKKDNFKSISDVFMDFFSDTDIESLIFSWENFGKFNSVSLSLKILHKYPEYEKLKEELEKAPNNRIEMNLEDLFEDNQVSLDNFDKLNKDKKSIIIDEFREKIKISELWSS